VRISSLAVRDLRRHRDTTIELAPGLTVIRGPNEAGKSTLQRAIELGLVRKVTSAAQDLDGLVPWDGGANVRPAISLAFTYEDEDGDIHEGRVAKQFEGAKGTVRLELDGEVITDPARSDELLAELSGLPTEAFFRSTASVRHHELAGLQRDESALRDRLQASISGADRGTSRARKQLERALQGLRAGGAKNPGRLKVADDAVADVTRKLASGEEALARLQHDRDALSLARERKADAEKALTERRAMLEKARQAERLAGERETAREHFYRYREAVTLRDEIADLDASHPSPLALPLLRPAIQRLRSLETKISTLEEMLAGDVKVDFELPPEVRWQPLYRTGLALVAVGVVVAALGFALNALAMLSLGPAIPIVGAVIAVVGVVLAAAGWMRRRNDHLQRQLRDVEVMRRLRGRSEIEQELKTAEGERDQELEALGLETTALAEERLASEELHVAQIDQRRARLGGLIGEEPHETLGERRDAASLEIEQKTAALEALGPIAKEPRARERLEVEVGDAERQLERGRDDEAAARARVEQNPVDAEEVAALAERLAGWQDELEILKRRERVYAQTLQAINSAEQATMQRATRYLERRMVGDISRITDGRYKRVRVNDQDLGIDVFSPERNDWVPVTELSQGTLDVVYLAARLGLVRLVTGDRRPPLVLDDPFVTLDDDRAARALGLLREVASDFQVIYLTTSDRYDAQADKVVVLEGPTAVDGHTALEEAAAG
jgi:DNA repair exonuclease SbcCD ATPase subunit